MIKIPGPVPITIHPFFFLLCGLIGWINTPSILGVLVWGVVIFISIIVHEYGHALTALAFNQKAKITLFALGGLTERRGKEPLKTWQECLIVANGPLAGFGLFFLSVYLHGLIPEGKMPIFSAALQISMAVNLIWTILNLFPVQPLDGGRLMALILERFMGVNGVKLAYIISIAVAAVAATLFFFTKNLLGGALFLLFAFESYRAFEQASKLSSQDSNEDLIGLAKEAELAEKRGDQSRAEEVYQEINRTVSRGYYHRLSSYKLALFAYQRGEIERAYDLINQCKKEPEVLQLKQQILMKRGEYHESLKLGEKLFLEQPTFEGAMQNAFAAAQSLDERRAVGWLRRAQEMANVPIHHLINHKELDPIRQTDQFKQLIA